jgi:hypothetical protein
LLNFYHSLPYSQRTAIIEESLRAYLDKLSAKELERYRKIIPPKIKPKKLQPKLTAYLHANFTCDNCGDEYYNDTAYSFARNLEEFKRSYTYCFGCVGSE